MHPCIFFFACRLQCLFVGLLAGYLICLLHVSMLLMDWMLSFPYPCNFCCVQLGYSIFQAVHPGRYYHLKSLLPASLRASRSGRLLERMMALHGLIDFSFQVSGWYCVNGHVCTCQFQIDECRFHPQRPPGATTSSQATVTRRLPVYLMPDTCCLHGPGGGLLGGQRGQNEKAVLLHKRLPYAGDLVCARLHLPQLNQLALCLEHAWSLCCNALSLLRGPSWYWVALEIRLKTLLCVAAPKRSARAGCCAALQPSYA